MSTALMLEAVATSNILNLFCREQNCHIVEAESETDDDSAPPRCEVKDWVILYFHTSMCFHDRCLNAVIILPLTLQRNMRVQYLIN